MEEKAAKEDKNQGTKTPALEWVFAIIGLILVVGVISFLLYHIATDKERPPNLSVKVDEIVSNEKSFLVKFVLVNTGDETAADVTIEGELKKGGESVETGEVTVDYVPAHSEKKGGLIFTKNPGEFEFEIRAKGYNEP